MDVASYVPVVCAYRIFGNSICFPLPFLQEASCYSSREYSSSEALKQCGTRTGNYFHYHRTRTNVRSKIRVWMQSICSIYFDGLYNIFLPKEPTNDSICYPIVYPLARPSPRSVGFVAILYTTRQPKLGPLTHSNNLYKSSVLRPPSSISLCRTVVGVSE